eukprot:742944-Rhodomonas_salina.1
MSRTDIGVFHYQSALLWAAAVHGLVQIPTASHARAIPLPGTTWRAAPLCCEFPSALASCICLRSSIWPALTQHVVLPGYLERSAYGRFELRR